MTALALVGATVNLGLRVALSPTHLQVQQAMLLEASPSHDEEGPETDDESAPAHPQMKRS